MTSTNKYKNQVIRLSQMLENTINEIKFYKQQETDHQIAKTKLMDEIQRLKEENQRYHTLSPINDPYLTIDSQQSRNQDSQCLHLLTKTKNYIEKINEVLSFIAQSIKHGTINDNYHKIERAFQKSSVGLVKYQDQYLKVAINREIMKVQLDKLRKQNTSLFELTASLQQNFTDTDKITKKFAVEVKRLSEQNRRINQQNQKLMEINHELKREINTLSRQNSRRRIVLSRKKNSLTKISSEKQIPYFHDEEDVSHDKDKTWEQPSRKQDENKVLKVLEKKIQLLEQQNQLTKGLLNKQKEKALTLERERERSRDKEKESISFRQKSESSENPNLALTPSPSSADLQKQKKVLIQKHEELQEQIKQLVNQIQKGRKKVAKIEGQAAQKSRRIEQLVYQLQQGEIQKEKIITVYQNESHETKDKIIRHEDVILEMQKIIKSLKTKNQELNKENKQLHTLIKQNEAHGYQKLIEQLQSQKQQLQFKLKEALDKKNLSTTQHQLQLQQLKDIYAKQISSKQEKLDEYQFIINTHEGAKMQLSSTINKQIREISQMKQLIYKQQEQITKYEGQLSSINFKLNEMLGVYMDTQTDKLLEKVKKILQKAQQTHSKNIKQYLESSQQVQHCTPDFLIKKLIQLINFCSEKLKLRMNLQLPVEQYQQLEKQELSYHINLYKEEIIQFNEAICKQRQTMEQLQSHWWKKEENMAKQIHQKEQQIKSLQQNLQTHKNNDKEQSDSQSLLEQLEKYKEQQDQLVDEIAKLTYEINNKQEQCDGIRRQCEGMKRQVQKYQKENGQIQTLEEELLTAQLKITEFQSQIQQLTESVQIKQELLNNHIAESQTKIQLLNQTLEQNEKIRQEFETQVVQMKQERQKTNLQKKQLLEQYKDVCKKLSCNDNEYVSMEQGYKQKMDKITALNQQLQENYQSLETEYKFQKQNNIQLQSNLEEINLRNGQLESDYQSTNNKYKELTSCYQQFSQKYEGINSECQKLKQQNNQLLKLQQTQRQQLQKAQQHISKIRQQYEGINSEYQQLKQKNNQLSIHLNNLQSSKYQELNKVQQRLQKIRQEYQGRNLEYQGLQEKNNELHQLQEIQRQELQKAQQQIQTMKQELGRKDQLSNQIKSLKAEISEAWQTVGDKQSEIRNMREAIQEEKKSKTEKQRKMEQQLQYSKDHTEESKFLAVQYEQQIWDLRQKYTAATVQFHNYKKQMGLMVEDTEQKMSDLKKINTDLKSKYKIQISQILQKFNKQQFNLEINHIKNMLHDTSIAIKGIIHQLQNHDPISKTTKSRLQICKAQPYSYGQYYQDNSNEVKQEGNNRSLQEYKRQIQQHLYQKVVHSQRQQFYQKQLIKLRASIKQYEQIFEMKSEELYSNSKYTHELQNQLNQFRNQAAIEKQQLMADYKRSTGQLSGQIQNQQVMIQDLQEKILEIGDELKEAVINKKYYSQKIDQLEEENNKIIGQYADLQELMKNEKNKATQQLSHKQQSVSKLDQNVQQLKIMLLKLEQQLSQVHNQKQLLEQTILIKDKQTKGYLQQMQNNYKQKLQTVSQSNDSVMRDLMDHLEKFIKDSEQKLSQQLGTLFEKQISMQAKVLMVMNKSVQLREENNASKSKINQLSAEIEKAGSGIILKQEQREVEAIQQNHNRDNEHVQEDRIRNKKVQFDVKALDIDAQEPGKQKDYTKQFYQFANEETIQKNDHVETDQKNKHSASIRAYIKGQDQLPVKTNNPLQLSQAYVYQSYSSKKETLQQQLKLLEEERDLLEEQNTNLKKQIQRKDKICIKVREYEKMISAFKKDREKIMGELKLKDKIVNKTEKQLKGKCQQVLKLTRVNEAYQEELDLEKKRIKNFEELYQKYKMQKKVTHHVAD